MAAYNGATWIEEQIESILSQKNVAVNIFISVDFSADDTLNICIKYGRKYKNVHILSYGDSYGSAASNFFRLIRDVDISEFDYIAFSDQDDVWLPEKISEAISCMKNAGADCYASNLTLWENGKVGAELKKSQQQRDFDYIFQGASAGCTYVLNKDSFSFLQSKICKIESLDKKMSHDWIAYAVTRSKKYKWVIDPNSYILYRQHSLNVQGARLGIVGGVKKLMQIRSGWYFSNILKLQDFLEMDDHEKKIMEKISRKGLSSKLWLISNAFEYRRKVFDAIVLMVIFVFY